MAVLPLVRSAVVQFFTEMLQENPRLNAERFVPELSVVVPAFDEVDNAACLADEIIVALSGAAMDGEVMGYAVKHRGCRAALARCLWQDAELS